MDKLIMPVAKITVPVDLERIKDELEKEDIVRVIRCKDCKYWDGRYCHNQWWGDGHVYYTPPIKTEDGYCDWAEREKDGTDKQE